jgi:putative endopeptidase
MLMDKFDDDHDKTNGDNHMKKILLATACVALLAACEPAEEVAEDTQLGSGINLEYMDTNIRPQDDFYRYVNGTWLDNTEIPGDRTSWGGFSILRAESEANQRTIVEAMAARNDLVDGTEEQKVGDMFASFMDVEAVNAAGSDPVQPYIARIMAVSSYQEWFQLTSEFRIDGVSASPFGLAIFGDMQDSTHYKTYFFQSGLGLPNRDYYLEDSERNNTVRAAYPQFLARLYELAGIDNGEALAADVMAFETALAEIQWPSAKLRDRSIWYNPYTAEELNAVNDAYDWGTYLDASHVGGAESVIIIQPDYLENALALIAETPLETLKAYYIGRVLDAASTYLSDDFVQADQDFNGAVLAGRAELPERWKTGVRLVNAMMGEAVGKIYVEEYFPPEAKARMETLVNNLIVAFGDAIDDLEWMSDETKARAQEKRNKFMTKIGYPDVWRDYSAMAITRSNFFANLVAANQYEYMRVANRLNEEVDRTEWGMTPQTVNAYHNPSLNEIVFPAAILQPPFFNLNAEDAVNYGGIGAVIGHEMGHAFDDNGRRFDGNGNMNDWWTEADATSFEASAAALVEQYDSFEALPDLNVNGQLTLGENIGDLTGVTIGWRAYIASLNGAEPPVIDGFTAKQRYLIGFAQIWRNLSTDEAMQRRVVGDPHSPSRFRANGTLMNSPMFMEVYGVEEGDGMYRPPEDQVKIW